MRKNIKVLGPGSQDFFITYKKESGEHMKSSNIGGQAVLEGIMMKNKNEYAVAVRKPDGEIALMKEEYKSIFPWKKLTTTPFIRGAFNFVDSMILGTTTLNYSASFFDEYEEQEMTDKEYKKKERRDNLMMILTMVVSVGLGLGLFMVLPYFLIQLISPWVPWKIGQVILEGGIRIGMFVAYILLVSRMEDIRRTFMYHGAEHKCINCIESGLDLTVENVRKSTKIHRRCGTSFIFFVLLVSMICLFFINTDSMLTRVLVRILMLPFIAGISFELIKWAGCSSNWFINMLSKPGLWMQELTTKEPEDDMIEVAIVAVEAVFDWKAYVSELRGEE